MRGLRLPVLPRPPSERAKLARLAAADSPALHWLERGALAAIQGIEALLGSGEDARAAGCRLAVYGMSRALLPAEVRTGERIRLLEEFFRRYPFCDARAGAGCRQTRRAGL